MDYISYRSSIYWRSISALFLGSFVNFALLYCTQPLIPLFSKQYAVTPSVASLSVSLVTGPLALFMIILSWISDAKGRKIIMTLSLLSSAILTIVAACSGSFRVLLVVRALQGITLAGFPAIAMAYVNEEFEPGSTGLVMGIYVSGTSVGGMLGRVITGALTDMFSWQTALIVIALISLLVSGWFWLSLPKARHFPARRRPLAEMTTVLLDNLRQPTLQMLYVIAFLMMGGFVTLYNYFGYSLMAPPYNLSQTVVGFIFLVYITGTFSSTFMGRLADRFGATSILFLSLMIMLIGGLITLTGSLILKITGIAIFTFGFFGSHAVASALVGKCASSGKAQASALYLLFYYLGSSIIGAIGGNFLSWLGWNGVVLAVGIVVSIALLFSASLMRQRNY